MQENSLNQIKCQGTYSDLLRQPVAISSYDGRPWETVTGIINGRVALTNDLSKGLSANRILEFIGSDIYNKCIKAVVASAKDKTDKASQQITAADNPFKKASWLASFGLTSGTRAKDSHPVATGMTVVDCDHISSDKNELVRLGDLAKELPYTVAAFISPSGDGLKILCATVKVDGFMVKDSPALVEQKYYNEQIHKGVAEKLSIPYGDDTSLGRSTGKVDADCAEARRGTYIPVNSQVLWQKDGEYTFSLVPYEVQPVIPVPQKKIQTNDFACQTEENPLTPEEVVAINNLKSSLLAKVVNCSDGMGHHSENACAYALGRYISLMTSHGWTVNGIADEIRAAISAQDNPDPDAETEIANGLRDGMAKSLTASAYRQWQAANPSKKPVGRPAKELPKITGDDDIDWEEWQSKLPDLLSDAQPVDTFCWDEDAVTHLMVLCFLNKYRFCGAGRGVCLASGQVYDLAYMNTITGKKWRYSDAKGNLHKVSLQEAFALWGTRLGEHTVELVDRIDLPPHQIKVMKPLPESQYIAPCYNKSVGLPTRGLNFQDYITPQAVEDAQKVCEFIVSRFIDHKSYPNQEYCNQMAERDAMYYMEYIYQAIMHPELKPPCAIACLSLARGTGKSTLTVEIPKILAGRSCAKLVLGNEVTSDGALRFSWVKVTGALFMTYDDFNDPKTSMASIFRGMITADTLFVETKGVQGHSETNLARLFFSSNKREFLRELNDGGDERRFHLFRFPNLVKDDPKAHATWKLIQGYVSKVSSDTTLTGCPELQAFRCALLTEFRRRIDAWEAAGNKVSLEVALDTAECRSQRNLGLEHNKVAREAAKLVYDSPDKAFKLGTRELYRQVKLAPGCASLTDKVIAQAMEDSHFFEGKNHHGLTIFRLTPSGLAAISGSSPEEEILTNWDKIQTSKERMEKFASLVQDGKITYEETGDCRYSVQVVGHDMTTYEISLCGNDDKKESNIIRFSGSNPGGVETVFEQTDLTEFLELDA